MLVLIASRHKGEYVPAVVLRVVGHPLVLLGVYGPLHRQLVPPRTGHLGRPTEAFRCDSRWLRLCGVDHRGDPARRFCASRGCGTAGGARDDRSEHYRVRTGWQCEGAHPGGAPVGPDRFAGNRSASAQGVDTQDYPNGDSDGLAAQVEVRDEAESRVCDPSDSAGQVVVPLSCLPYQVGIRL